MISNVVREFHWEPAVIDRLFLDSQDHRGIVFWNDELTEMNRKLNEQ